MTVKELKAQRKAALDAAKAVKATADSDDRAMTDEEHDEAKGHMATVATLNDEIAEAKARQDEQNDLQARMDAETERLAQPEPRRLVGSSLQNPADTRVEITGGRDATTFGGFGEWMFSVRSAAIDPSHQDPRLTADALFPSVQAAAPGLLTTIDSDGGFLIPDEQREGVLGRVYEMGELISRAQQVPMSGNTFKIPYINETSRATGSRSGGVRFYWTEEASTITDSKPQFGQCELSVKKCAALGYVTEDMMEDQTATGALMERLFTDEVIFGVENSMFRGTGAGQPLGVLNAPCKVTVSKETNQTADTVWGPNVVKMWARMPSKNRKQAVWLINQDVEPQLWSLTLEGRYASASTSVEGIALFNPAGTETNKGDYSTLMGRPVIPIEYASTVGNLGDISLVDWNDYLLGTKGAAKQAWSIHVRFLTDERTFRVTMRVDGQPWWSSALTPFQGSNTLSPVVMLEAR